MPYTLPHRPGYTVVHVHEEGERCILEPEPRQGMGRCKYVPTLLRRLRWRLGL